MKLRIDGQVVEIDVEDETKALELYYSGDAEIVEFDGVGVGSRWADKDKRYKNASGYDRIIEVMEINLSDVLVQRVEYRGRPTTGPRTRVGRKRFKQAFKPA